MTDQRNSGPNTGGDASITDPARRPDVDASTPTRAWYGRPSIALPVVATVVFLALLVSPTPRDRDDPRLSTYSTDPSGAGLLYELAERLGFVVGRSTSAVYARDRDVVHVVLAPTVPLRAADAHALLEHVRGGGALLVVTTAGAERLADSLGLDFGGVASMGRRNRSRRCPGDVTAPLRAAAQTSRLSGFRLDSARAELAEVLYSVSPRVSSGGEPIPVAVALTLGAGRIVAIADGDMLRNDLLRQCDRALDRVAVRALEYLDRTPTGGTRRFVFDEYHQGYGVQRGSLRATLAQFSRTAAGRTLYQLAGAGVLLLLAAAPRLLPPRDAPSVERRSPLEHVDALSRAYLQVGATRTATGRLVRGLRRRVARASTHGGARRTPDDLAFLAGIAATHPSLRGAVDLIDTALRQPVDRATFLRVADAIGTIEATLNTT